MTDIPTAELLEDVKPLIDRLLELRPSLALLIRDAILEGEFPTIGPDCVERWIATVIRKRFPEGGCWEVDPMRGDVVVEWEGDESGDRPRRARVTVYVQEVSMVEGWMGYLDRAATRVALEEAAAAPAPPPWDEPCPAEWRDGDHETYMQRTIDGDGWHLFCRACGATTIQRDEEDDDEGRDIVCPECRGSGCPSCGGCGAVRT